MRDSPTFAPSASRTPEYAEYRRKVISLAESRTGEAIYNGSVEHAIIVIETLFRYAKQTVQILTGSLNPLVYGPMEVVVAAHGFLTEPDRTVEVVLEDDPIPGNPFIAMLGELQNLHMRRLRRAGGVVYGCHFVLADGDCYRFEQDKSKVSAVAAFGDREGGEVIAGAFDHVWKDSDPLKRE